MKFPFRVAVGEDQAPGTAIAFSNGKFCVILDDGSFTAVYVYACRVLTKLEGLLSGE